jgi:hypothetical protein
LVEPIPIFSFYFFVNFWTKSVVTDGNQRVFKPWVCYLAEGQVRMGNDWARTRSVWQVMFVEKAKALKVGTERAPPLYFFIIFGRFSMGSCLPFWSDVLAALVFLVDPIDSSFSGRFWFSIKWCLKRCHVLERGSSRVELLKRVLDCTKKVT